MQIQRGTWILAMATRCDLLKFMYLCWCSYNLVAVTPLVLLVVICWNLCTFAGAVTTFSPCFSTLQWLWFAEIYVPLLVQLQHEQIIADNEERCDLLKFMYLCWCSYNYIHERSVSWDVVICWNLCTFAGAVTTLNFDKLWKWRCDLLKFMYLCWCSYNFPFVLSNSLSLWFAEIYVPLLVQLQRQKVKALGLV